MPDTPEQTLAKLHQAQADAKTMVRELHEVIQAGKAFLKDLRTATAEAKAAVPTAVEEQLAAEVERQLAMLSVQTKAAMDASVEKVMSEFRILTDSMLGKKGTDKDLRPRMTAYFADTGVKGTNCPSCGEILSDVTELDGPSKPEPGDFSLCAYCGTILRFTADMGVRRVLPGETELLEPAMMTAFRVAQLAVEANGKANGST